MTLKKKLFNISDAIDNDAKYPYSLHSRKPIRKEIRELTTTEIPIELKESLSSNVANPKISKRLKRAVDAQTTEEERIQINLPKAPDSYSMRAFKDYLYSEDIYGISSLDDIPRLSQRPNSIMETVDISPKIDYTKSLEIIDTTN